ncbi:MAG: tol-pal system-associated acyl-CoA thioesterase [Rhodobacteraceae bacterium]|nr:MAG: tol-pal system-associated acyl-CoA thioesterase [Paracoccaceae bacterium]
MTPHRLVLRVYYEDTDLAGIVYHANYLKFMERGRTEALRAAGVDQTRLKAEGLVFVVARMAIDFRRPARFDDLLTVETIVARLGAATAEMRQTVLRDDLVMAEAAVRVACMGEGGRAARLPAAVRAALGGGA